MRNTILVLFRSWLPGKKGGELLIEVDEVLRIFTALKLVLGVSDSFSLCAEYMHSITHSFE